MDDRYAYLYEHAEVLKDETGLELHVPPRPAREDDDISSDMPNGVPPMVHFQGGKENYWLIIQDKGSHLDLNEAQIQWLKGKREEVESLMPKRHRPT